MRRMPRRRASARIKRANPISGNRQIRCNRLSLSAVSTVSVAQSSCRAARERRRLRASRTTSAWRPASSGSGGIGGAGMWSAVMPCFRACAMSDSGLSPRCYDITRGTSQLFQCVGEQSATCLGAPRLGRANYLRPVTVAAISQDRRQPFAGQHRIGQEDQALAGRAGRERGAHRRDRTADGSLDGEFEGSSRNRIGYDTGVLATFGRRLRFQSRRPCPARGLPARRSQRRGGTRGTPRRNSGSGPAPRRVLRSRVGRLPAAPGCA